MWPTILPVCRRCGASSVVEDSIEQYSATDDGEQVVAMMMVVMMVMMVMMVVMPMTMVVTMMTAVVPRC